MRRATSRRLAAALSVAVTAIALSAAPAGTEHAAAAPTPLPIYLNTHYSFAERAADLVSRMTLAEKVAQLRTNSAPAIPRLGVQQYTYWSEGQHGINTPGRQHQPRQRRVAGSHATSFPTNFAATHVLGPAADVPGDDRDLRRGARLPGQVAVGRRPEQHRPATRTTTAR